VARGHDDDFIADALEFQVDRRARHRQAANSQRFDVDRQRRTCDVHLR
jgi:hypothetical protein